MKPFQQHFRYLITVFLLAWLAIPVIAQILLIPLAMHVVLAVVVVVLFLVLLVGSCRSWARRADLPDSLFWRFLPIAAAFVWYMLAYVVVFGLAQYQFGSDLFGWLTILTLPWLVVNFFLAFDGDYTLFPFIITAVYGLIVIIFAIFLRVEKRRGTGARKALSMLGVLVLLCGVCGYQFYARSTRVLGGDYNVLKVEDEVDLYEYRPFRQGNRLQTPGSPPSLTILEDYPRLDGATAAYPVYGAMAQAIYQGLDADNVGDYVNCTTTSEAYERLINGEVDIFFGAQPSQQQIEQAAENSVELQLHPIAREAFVFFVNRDNPVEALTITQIQDIYQRKISNWRQVGGANESILAFQRPQNSGSQTIMQRVMGEKSLPEPLIEEYAAGMGGVINGVAAYRNYAGAIGYSFRYFATGMKLNEDIRLLAVEGVAPTVENIRTETYPFTVDVYAVTAGDPQGNSKLLLDWILSDEGQALIEQCGYVGIEATE